MIKWISLFFGIFFSTVGLPQTRFDVQPLWTLYNQESSDLPSNFVVGVQKDAFGYMWVVSENQIFRFNGKIFEPIINAKYKEKTIPYILGFIEPNLLLISYFDGSTVGINTQNRQFINTDSILGLDKIRNTTNNYVALIKHKDSIILLKKKFSDDNNSIPYVVVVHKNKAILLNKYNEAYNCISAVIFNGQYKENNDYIKWYVDLMTSFSTFNNKNNLTVIGNKLFSKEKKNLYADFGASEFKNFPINCALQRGKELWLGLMGKGLIRYNNFTDSGFNSSKTCPLPNQFIWDICEDDEKNIWISCLKKGIYKIKNCDVNSVYLSAKQDNEDEGYNALSQYGENSIVAFRYGNIDFISPQNTITSSNLNCTIIEIFEFGKKWYAFTSMGFVALNLNEQKTFSIGRLINNQNTCVEYNIHQDVCSILFLDGSIGELYTDGSFKYKSLQNSKLSTANCFLQLNDSISLVGSDKGIFYNGEKLNIFKNEVVYCMTNNANYVYFGTPKGLFSCPINQLNDFRKLVLIDSLTYKFFTSKDKLMFFYSNESLAVVDGEKNKIVKKFFTKNFNQHISLHGVLIDSSSHLIMNTNKGIFKFPLSDFLGEKEFHPRCHIINSLNNKIADDSLYRCLYNKDLFAIFDIDFLDFSYPNRNIQYRVLKDDESYIKWTEASSNSSIRLQKPEPGTYQIEYAISVPERNFNQVYRYQFIVSPLWWQTIWFRLLAAILVLLSILLIVYAYLKLKNKKRIEKINYQLKNYELEAKALSAQLNPHFIFNALTPFQDYTLKGDKTGALGYVNKFAGLMRGILNNTRMSKVKFSEELNFIRNYLDVQKSRLNDRFDYSILVDPNIDGENIKIPTLMIQPIVENAIEHGIKKLERKGMIIIECSLKNNLLLVVISDNGKGLPYDFKFKENHALAILNERLILMRDSEKSSGMTFKSNDFEGTTFDLLLPISIT